MQLNKFHSYPVPEEKHWQRYLIDSLMAVGGVVVVTGIIYAYHLYPTIPNISLVYLLLILLLATTRGRYAAIVAAVVAFLAFDFFLVPPLLYLCHLALGGMDCPVYLPRDGFDHEPAHDTDASKCRASTIKRA